MTHFLKYVSARVFFGTFVSLFAVFRVLSWYHEGIGGGDTDWPLMVVTWLAVLAVVSALMSLWGRWRIGQMLNAELDDIRREYHPRLLIRAYRRLLSYLESCWFFNTTRAKLSRRVAARFGDILLGMRIEDEQALSIYEDVLAADPGRERYSEFLISAYSRKARLEEKSFNCLRRRFHERPDDRLVGILAREYTLRRKLNFESERVLLTALKLYPRHKAKVIRFAVPRLISFGRTDDNAARFYLAAAEIGYDTEVAGMLRKLERIYRSKERDDALANRLFKTIEEKQIPSADDLPDKLGSRPGDWGEQEDVDSFRLEGMDDGDESLARQGMEEAGLTRDISLDSRFHNWLQRLVAGGRAPVGRSMRYLRIVMIVSVVAAAAYFSRPLWQRTVAAFGEKEDAKTESVSEDSGPAEGERREGNFSIQVAALGDSSRAAELAGRLTGRGIPARVSPSMAGSRRLYRVRLGAYATQQAAEREAAGLLAEGVIDEWQVVEEQR
ncbi:MAG: SPOR domain-containing protein [Candidatus Glassbacteria bacterium]|nr:SPOR domain-containing protein [Candidatus Glassbacteria bacterium]